MAKPVIIPTTMPTITPHVPTPAVMPQAMSLAMYIYGYACNYTHGYATWLCPKAMPINNFYGGLHAKKITLSIIIISFLTFIRLSLPNIFI